MRILIAGGSGLIGSALSTRFENLRHHVTTLSRNPRNKDNTIAWDPEKQEIDLRSLKQIDVCINLAGENIAAKRWSDSQKQLIQSSRISAVETLLKGFAQLEHPPKSFLCASAIGFYGDRGSEQLDENAAAGSGFLSETVVAWEQVAAKANALNIRTVFCRFGVVLSPKGGALKQMLPIFKLGLGGKIGSGEQFLSWVSIDDAISAIDYLMCTNVISGAVNIVSPNPLTNRDFSETLAQVLHRPCFCSVPRFALKVATGEMGETLLLSSTKVIPKKLLESEFKFQHTALKQTLVELLDIKYP